METLLTKKASELEKFEKLDYLLIILLLAFSGNPFTTLVLEKFTPLIVCTAIIYFYRKQIKPDFYKRFAIIAVGLLVIYLLQLVVLYYVSWLAGIRYIVTILLGGLVYYLLGDKFSFKLFIVMYYICLISLFGFLLINILQINIPGIFFMEGSPRVTYIVYTYLVVDVRNSGMFWEPGAFGGLLSLCIALNIKDLPFLWKRHKLKVIVVLLALLSTQSTTTYLVFFAIIIYYLLFFYKNNKIKFAIIPVFIAISVLVYTNADFLQAKVDAQTERSLEQVGSEYSNRRLGSFIFDSYYIKKHPIVGNGFSATTRYADHPYLVGQQLGNGNGFSHFMASLGIPFMVLYFALTFTSLYKISSKVAFLVCMVIFLNLWGEQWLYFPMYMGILFVHNKNKSKGKSKFESLLYDQK
ncbi:MAG: hypothetical protein ABIN97_09100 [Ginsengibacter sp.]